MQEINVYVKGVVYGNAGKGLALSAWGVIGKPIQFIEHEEESSFGAERKALIDAIKHLYNEDTKLHFYSNLKPLMSQGENKRIPDVSTQVQENCEFVWFPVYESPAPLVVLRKRAMQDIEKRAKAREKKRGGSNGYSNR